jgi:hypothetical protein
MSKLNPDHVVWSRNIFGTLADDGSWGIPRSGLIFVKRGNELQLTARMPHDPAMPITAEQLIEQQRSDFDGTKTHFEAAGITVVDLTPEGKTK